MSLIESQNYSNNPLIGRNEPFLSEIEYLKLKEPLRIVIIEQNDQCATPMDYWEIKEHVWTDGRVREIQKRKNEFIALSNGVHRFKVSLKILEITDASWVMYLRQDYAKLSKNSWNKKKIVIFGNFPRNK